MLHISQQVMWGVAMWPAAAGIICTNILTLPQLVTATLPRSFRIIYTNIFSYDSPILLGWPVGNSVLYAVVGVAEPRG
jgi:hypothetical protein